MAENGEKRPKPSALLSIVCWASLFVLTWLMVLDIVPLDELRALTWLFFFVVGVTSAAIADPNAKKRRN